MCMCCIRIACYCRPSCRSPEHICIRLVAARIRKASRLWSDRDRFHNRSHPSVAISQVTICWVWIYFSNTVSTTTTITYSNSTPVASCIGSYIVRVRRHRTHRHRPQWLIRMRRCKVQHCLHRMRQGIKQIFSFFLHTLLNYKFSIRYADLGDIFNEVGDISASAPASAKLSSRQIPTPTSANSIAIPRPPSRRSEAAVRGRVSPSTISRADSVGSLEFRTASIGIGSSRGPSPLTIGMSDTIPLAVAFHEFVHAYFR